MNRSCLADTHATQAPECSDTIYREAYQNTRTNTHDTGATNKTTRLCNEPTHCPAAIAKTHRPQEDACYRPHGPYCTSSVLAHTSVVCHHSWCTTEARGISRWSSLVPTQHGCGSNSDPAAWQHDHPTAPSWLGSYTASTSNQTRTPATNGTQIDSSTRIDGKGLPVADNGMVLPPHGTEGYCTQIYKLLCQCGSRQYRTVQQGATRGAICQRCTDLCPSCSNAHIRLTPPCSAIPERLAAVGKPNSLAMNSKT